MATYHTVEQGECLQRIAARYGFTDYRVIYNHSENAELRQRRPNPNLLYPGDRIYIPDKDTKEHAGSSDRRHKFVWKGISKLLRIALENEEGERQRNVAYELEVGGQIRTGQTDSDGMLKEKLPVDVEQATLRFQGSVVTLLVGHLNPLEDCLDDGVSGIQARLQNLGYYSGQIDGISGPATREAIVAFQRDNPPLVVDGICGPKTRAKLKERYGC